ncbi:MAG: DUF3300 domain-containing protein [Terracidiphilus sp.]|jgi:hypothetical protein
MTPQTNLRVLSSASVSPQLNHSPSESILNESSARHRTSAFWLIPCAALAIAALALAADATAQQPYPGAPYDNPPQAGQYEQPAPQNGYAPPQYQAPQYQPPATQNQPYPDQPPQYAPQYSAPQQPYAPQPYADQSQAPAPAQSLSAQDLEQLLAPIALYPDSLLAQILAASTYPAEVAIADQWVQQMRAAGYGSPDQIAAGANAQASWDPSIEALTAFPDVLDMLNHDLEWTTNLGNAYYNQPQDVMQTVQVLRQRAEQAGNLQSTPQEEVQNDQGYIDLAPTNPQVVSVPTYDPWDVYGQPIAPYPGFSFIGALGNFFGGIPIQYGLSFALGAFDRMPFGWLSWGLDWLGHSVLFDHSGYYTRSNTVADWGLPRGGPRAYGRGGSWNTRRDTYQANRGRLGYDQGGNYQRGGFSNNRGGAQSYVHPAQGYTEPGRFDHSPQGYSRTAPQQNYGYRPQTYPNREQTYMNRGYETRPQGYSNPGYSYGYTGRSNYGYTGPQTFATRPSFAYSSPSRSYRAPQPDYSRGYSSRSYENHGNSVARNERSGGFHLFGGGTPRGFSSPRAPKYSYKAPKGFGGGHQSFGGGHMSAPKMSHSSGGNHRR